MDKGTSRQTLQLYWRYSRPYRKYTIGSMVLIPIMTLVRVQLVALVVARVIDELAAGQFLSLADYLPYIGLLVVLEIADILLGQFNFFLSWRHENYISVRLFNICFNALSQKSASFYANNFAGSLISQTSKFVYSYERLYNTILYNVYLLVCSVLLSATLLWFRSPYIALTMVSFALLYAWVVIVQWKKQAPLNVRWSKAENKRTGILSDSLTNILAVKSLAQEEHEKKLFREANNTVKRWSETTMWAVLKKGLLLGPINGAAAILAIVFAITSVIWWDQPIGTVVLVLALSRDILTRIVDLNFVMRNLNRIFGDAHDMTKLLTTEPSVLDEVGAKTLNVSSGDISFSKISFAHDDQMGNTELFNNFDLDIKAGERVGLVGPSGGGKTTITKLLLRFMDIDSGQITIDDQDIAKVKQQSLRSHIAYVPQEPLLFHRSLAENIGYGRPAASQAEIEAAAKSAHAHEFISKLPKGYDTKVGERGVKLSGGQRQRIAIARAILKNAPILILDEATSALDSSSEVHIQKALWELMKDRTALVIAHRLSTVQKMDRIIVLDEGRIVEQGKHEELLKSKGLYSELWSHQSGGFISE